MTAKQRRIVQWAVVGVVTLVAFWLTIAWSEPAPPTHIVFAGGPRPGSYDTAAGELAALVIADDGPRVDVTVTAGSVENLKLLVDGKADVTLVQSGIAASVAQTLDLGEVRAVARLYSEPLWVFYRADAFAELTLLSQLRPAADRREHRMWIASPGSGTNVIARELLRINGVTERNAKLLETDRTEALAAFERGEIEVLFAVAAPTSETIGKLLRMPGAKLMNFVNHRAYARRLPYVAAVDVEQGVLSFEENLPPQAVVLLAPAATLAVRSDLHPRVVEKLTKAAVTRYSGGNLVDVAGEFPSARGLELPQDQAAKRFLEDGESWASRNLPFWLERLLATLKLALIPLFAVLLPAMRVVPILLSLRNARRIRHKYRVLREVEDRMRTATTIAEIEAQLAENERLRDDVAALARDMPARFQNAIYDFRLHANLVRQEGIERLGAIRAKQAA